MFVVRGQYPSGHVVEQFGTEEEAEAARQRHLANGVPATMTSPLPPGQHVTTRCSFCGKDRGAVEGMVAGPTGAGVAICNECVALCGRVLDEARRRPHLPPSAVRLACASRTSRPVCRTTAWRP